MPRIVTIHQPDFIPWLGFFHRLWISDAFIVLDDAQFLRRGWHHRDKIKTSAGDQWLTLPVKKKGRFKERINEVELLTDQGWRRKHLQTITHNYKKTPYFKKLYPEFERIYQFNDQNLSAFNLRLIEWLANQFDIQMETHLSSRHPSSAAQTKRLVELSEIFEAKSYLSGTGAKDYLDEPLFARSGINVQWQDFRHPAYTQQFGPFSPRLSSIDYLFNCGPGNPFKCHES